MGFGGPSSVATRRRQALLLVVAGVCLVGSCTENNSDLPSSTSQASDAEAASSDPSSPNTKAPEAQAASSVPSGPSTNAPEAQVASSTPIRPDITIDLTEAGRPIDDRLFGTNVPAWLGGERLASDWLIGAIRDGGVTTIRMPGGSWSNEYDWAACEYGDAERCFATWAARPSDFITLLESTDTEGIWTVSANSTAQQAAAAVAFFNGEVGDDHVIGIDRNGEDWGTTDTWASLRAERGHPQPTAIRLWEYGNEVYGGRSDTGGDQCAAFGWESVWTCDGTEYVNGDAEHDGYLATRAAMLAVDASIRVGAVGVPDPSSWSNWGNEVIEAAGESLDFYVVHQYGFDSPPMPDEIARRATEMWPSTIESARDTLPAGVELAVTEYNLVSGEASDPEHTMTQVINALYLASSLGELASAGIPIANHWNLANGTTNSGTDYGIIDAEDGDPFPTFEAFAMWARAGRTLLSVGGDIVDLSVFPTRHDDGSLAIVVVAPIDTTQRLSLQIDGADPAAGWTASSLGAVDPTGDAFDIESTRSGNLEAGVMSVDIPSWSMTVIEVEVDSDG